MPKVEKSCEACGKLFSVWPTRADTAKTCSRKCAGVLTARKYKAKRPEMACVVCGNSFSCPPCHEKRKSCCSLECAHELSRRRAVTTGEDHSNWKGGSTVSDGYLYLNMREHPFPSLGNYVAEHRLIVEEWMRVEAPGHHFLVMLNDVPYLRSDVDVHHRNGNKRDNRRGNLLACTKPAHRAIHNGQPPMEGEVWPPIEGMVPYTPYRVTCTCETCGTEFQMKRSSVARGGGKFCTRLCYNNRPKEAFDVVTL
jgi:hypothetical protein